MMLLKELEKKKSGQCFDGLLNFFYLSYMFILSIHRKNIIFISIPQN